MASLDGKGSIILKIVIVLLVVAMIIVIILPGQIWQEEDVVMETSRNNMSTLFEAHKYYFGLKGTYTANDEDLILTVQNDSALLKRQIVVNHTTRLKNAMERFLSDPAIKNLYDISSNLKNIEDDLVNNKRFFRTIEAIDREAEELKRQISSLRSGIQFEKYVVVVTDLDSMWQLRRDLTDYSLQSAARLAGSFSEDISRGLPSIDFSSMNQIWQPLSSKISDLMSAVEGSRLKQLTSVSDRVADFQRDASSGFSYFLTNTVEDSYSDASSDLATVYNEFLSDFLITEEYSQYTLNETDSLLINISDRSFFTPRDQLKYIFSVDDSARIRVEDPTLLDELKAMSDPTAEEIKQLEFMAAFHNYQNQIDSLRGFYPQIKAKYRRNIEVTIKTKEIEAVLEELPSTVVFDAYLKAKSYVDVVPQTDSYSQIQNEIESTLISIAAFKQIYEDSFFGNLDTVHVDLIDQLNQFNELLSQIRRNTFSLDYHIESLNSALIQIKSVQKESVLPTLLKVEENLQTAYLFASEGKEKSIYGLFATRVINYGKIDGPTGRKSWEE
jgi:prefoldin subunit 5/competence protein ComGC